MKKIANLGLSAVRKQILEDIFGRDSKLERGKGPFSLKKQYKYLTVTDARWSVLSDRTERSIYRRWELPTKKKLKLRMHKRQTLLL